MLCYCVLWPCRSRNHSLACPPAFLLAYVHLRLVDVVICRFVDVGCGAGLATTELGTKHGLNMLGIDMHDDAVNWATAHSDSEGAANGAQGRAKGKVTFSRGSTYSLPIADASVDGFSSLFARPLVFSTCVVFLLSHAGVGARNEYVITPVMRTSIHAHAE